MTKQPKPAKRVSGHSTEINAADIAMPNQTQSPIQTQTQWLEVGQLSQVAQLYPWHQQQWQRMTARYPHLAHGILITGKRGCAKQAFSAYLVQWLLCQHKAPQGACGQCASCHWLIAGTHPRLKLIAPEYDEKKRRFGAIKIEQIRELGDFVQQTGDGYRLIVMNYAQQLNTAAANALLKILEEPGERVILILIADSALRLPATIRSRVQQLASDRMSPQCAADFLQQQLPSIAPLNRDIALQLAHDMPLAAAEWVQSDWFGLRSQFLTDWLKLATTKRTPLQFSIQWHKQLDIDALRMLLQFHVQDCINYKLQQPVKQHDLQFEALAAQYTLAELFGIWQYGLSIGQMLAQNVQTQLIVDALAMRLMNIPS